MDSETKKALKSIGEKTEIVTPEATDVYYGENERLRDDIDKKGLRKVISDYENKLDGETE